VSWAAPSRTMTPLMAATVFVAIASVVGQGMAGLQGNVGLAAFAAAAFVGAMLRVGWQVNRPWWRADTGYGIGPADHDAQPSMAATNARLLALGYGWGAASLLTVYILTPLTWQHGWQYGSGMALIAVAIDAVSRNLTRGWTRSRAKRLETITLLHGVAGLVAVGWLVGSGKIWSSKPDWAANVVFAAGGVIAVALSLMAIATNRALASKSS